MIPFKIATKFKYLRTNLSNEVKGLYNKNYKSLRKEIEKTSKGGKICYAHVSTQLIL
jgi:hypothetical protein